MLGASWTIMVIRDVFEQHHNEDIHGMGCVRAT